MADMKPSEILKAGLELLGPNGEHWTKRAYARKSNGDDTMVLASATCFCGLGALRAVVAKNNGAVSIEGYELLRCDRSLGLANSFLHATSPFLEWAPWQDQTNTTFSTVEAKFLEAIAMAEAEEAAQCEKEAA